VSVNETVRASGLTAITAIEASLAITVPWLRVCAGEWGS